MAVVAASAVGLAACGTVASKRPESQERTVVAEFTDASPLLVGNDVDVNGVRVGKITKMKVVNGKARVSFTVSAQALPLHTDAQVQVRPVSLLGERYLELHRGSPDAPELGDGGVLPVSQTSQNTDLDQVLDVVDNQTGDSLAALVTVLGQGMKGNGANTAATIKALAPAMNDTDGLMKILNKQNATLNSLVDNMTPVARALAEDKGKTADRLVDSTVRVLGTTAAREKALRSVLTELPGTLTTAQTTLADLAGVSNEAVPTLRSIRPTVDNLNAISLELEQFSDAADPALAHTQPVLKKAQTLLDAARPVSGELVKDGPPLRSVAKSAKPVVGELSDNIGSVMNFIRGWALATNGADGLGHYFRALVTISPYIATGLLPGGTAKDPQDPGDSADKGQGDDKAKDKDPAAPGAPEPGEPTTPGSENGGLTGLLNGLLPSTASSDGGITGLNPRQESGALQFLLGGGS
ncbi:MlaD family protein [Streptomyces physcomitrii]|uniref:MlaD family protein n=1 Tax=Streptomyces physcomitrii TaxID=2724184 RepID=UPI00196A0EE7